MRQSILRGGITLAGGISILVLMALLCVGILGSRIKSKPHYYDAKDVILICRFFQLDINDSFCVNPSIQNGITFEGMLNRKFPLNETDYDDIFPFTGQLHASVVSCAGVQIDSDFRFCPSPDKCELTPSRTYTCDFKAPGSKVIFSITFANSSGNIVDYLASRDNGS